MISSHWTRALVLAAIVGLGLCGGVRAGEPSGKYTPASLDAAIDLKVKDAKARQLLQTFGQILSVDVRIDPKIAGEVTVDLENTPVRAALDRVCEQIHCRWQVVEGKPRPALVVDPAP